MRISRRHALALLAGLFTIAGGPASASAQETAARRELVVQRTTVAPAEQDSAASARFNAINQDLNDLFDAQRAFFSEHRRFASDLAQLPRFTRGAQSGIRLTAGPDWYVALGGASEVGVMQQVVYFKEPGSTPVAQAAPGGETVAGQAERIEGTMARPR